MELLLTKNPLVAGIRAHSSDDIFSNLVEKASLFNVATGYITNESILELGHIARFRKEETSVPIQMNILVGMHYLDGITKIQYEALKRLNEYLLCYNLGKVMLSTKARYHGKMYSFMKSDQCLASFVGSSNLGSFMGISQNLLECDVMLSEHEGGIVNERIESLFNSIGEDLSLIPEITDFKAPEYRLLKNHENVRELSADELKYYTDMPTISSCTIPLKTTSKSNLNTYFGAGKVKGKYSRRDWFEVELIIGKGLNCPLPSGGEVFTVVTEDGYEFECQRQGDYDKNFRSTKDLRILGKWIKGQMIASGALGLGDMVTEDTLTKFGHDKILFEKKGNGKWYAKLV